VKKTATNRKSRVGDVFLTDYKTGGKEDILNPALHAAGLPLSLSAKT